ncbi:MAG TPA: transcription termination/antitermination protein NusG [Bryobacteraceae bacterium]|nr:transcription termination/antitermination protein NusG [Bryobacteraceae bacterium]
MADNKDEQQVLQALHDEPEEGHSQESAIRTPVDGTELEHRPEDLHSHEADGQDVLEQDETVLSDEIHPETGYEAEDGVHGTERETEVPEPLAEPVAGVAPAIEDAATTKRWYIIHAYSGFEQKVAESLKTRAQAFGFAERLGQILIPTEEVIELRNGKKVTSKRLLYPGYVLVEMEMDDELWHAVKSTPRVTGFVGGGTRPVPLTADEVNAVLYRQASSAERPRPKMSFEKNETVKIVDGPFTNFSGKVDEINMERNTLRVMVTIFGRSTPVELDFLQVEKI